MVTIDEMSSADEDINETFLKLIASGSAVVFVIIFGVVGEIALENMVYGALAGVFSGVGTFFFLPWFLHLSALQSASPEEVPLSSLTGEVTSSTQLGVFRLGLELGGISMIAIGLALDDVDYVIGAGAALLVAVSVYLAVSVFLNR